MTDSGMSLNILGCAAAIPAPGQMTSCQVLENRQSLYMIDCGEGAQTMFRRMRLPFNRLRHIFISHLHGDHCLGLPGLLSSMGLQESRDAITVHIFEPGAQQFDSLLRVIGHNMPLRIHWNVISPTRCGIILDEPSLTVETFPLRHADTPAVGFLFRQKAKSRHLRGDVANALQIPVWQRQAIREGADWTRPDGTVVPNAALTTPADPSVSYAYASDTSYSPHVVEAVRGVDVLYHEATYGHEFGRLAKERGHSTAATAARVAAEAGVGRLLIGHFSKRYLSTDPLVKEARAIFPATDAVAPGQKIKV